MFNINVVTSIIWLIAKHRHNYNSAKNKNQNFSNPEFLGQEHLLILNSCFIATL